MTDARSLADEAVHQLDRLAAAILDDVGDGPAPSKFAGIANEARDAVGKVGIPAFSELTGLVAGIANSLVDGTTDWSPSLGGTLMAAVDDLRTLILRPSPFNSEDSEHLHQRASELAAYSRGVRRGAESTSSTQRTTSPGRPSTVSPVSPGSPAAVVDQPSPAAQPSAHGSSLPVVPISSLFYSDGPQVVSGGVPGGAASRSDVLGAAVDTLDKLPGDLLAKPTEAGPMKIVPVETLIYRGRAALERAAAIREQIKASGTGASPAALDEMYDLIGLALKD